MAVKIFQPKEYLVNKNLIDIPESVKIDFNTLHRKFGNSVKVSDFIQMIECVYGSHFQLFDDKTWNDPRFLSHIIDLVIEFKNGKDVDLSRLHTELTDMYQFTKTEKRLFLEKSLEEKLWAIFLILNNPAHEEFNI